MPLASNALPYGLRDIKLFPLTGGTPGSAVDLPNARTMSFEESEDFEELRGDDKVVAVRGKGAVVDFEVESGGISLEAYVVMNGGAVAVSGVAPNSKKTYTKKSTDARPEFKAEGQAISDNGGDFHVVLHRCKATDGVSGELSDGGFWLTGCSGQAIGRASDDVIYEFVHNETVAPIV